MHCNKVQTKNSLIFGTVKYEYRAYQLYLGFNQIVIFKPSNLIIITTYEVEGMSVCGNKPTYVFNSLPDKITRYCKIFTSLPMIVIIRAKCNRRTFQNGFGEFRNIYIQSTLRLLKGFYHCI